MVHFFTMIFKCREPRPGQKKSQRFKASSLPSLMLVFPAFCILQHPLSISGLEVGGWIENCSLTLENLVFFSLQFLLLSNQTADSSRVGITSCSLLQLQGPAHSRCSICVSEFICSVMIKVVSSYLQRAVC